MSFLNFRRPTWIGRIAVAGLATLLAGCATLPSSGPTGQQVIKSAVDPATGQKIEIVELDTVAALPAAPINLSRPLATAAPPPTDMIGPSDVLEITIYEAGAALFGGGEQTSAAAAGSSFDPSVKTQKLPLARVDDRGFIQIPYAGRLKVMGHTGSEVEAMIRRALRGFSQNPQVLVTIRESITNSIIMGGEVAKPGRLVLPTNRETISDTIALAGGYRGDAKDLTVRVVRKGQVSQFRLADLMTDEAANFTAYPGDRISVISDPRSFSVLGASGRVEQFVFSNSSITLAQAIAQAGGANPGSGDPAAIFVFREVLDEQGNLVPVVYHLNMMKAGGYIIAQRFAMRDDDLVYFGNARANQPSKLVQIISQLFAPIVTVRDIARSVN